MQKFFTLRLYMIGTTPSPVFTQEQKDELFISPNLRLCGFNAMAHIESEKLARQFREAILPRLQERYGQDFDLDLVDCQETDSEQLRSRIDQDSQIIRKRLETGAFAGNISS